MINYWSFSINFLREKTRRLKTEVETLQVERQNPSSAQVEMMSKKMDKVEAAFKIFDRNKDGYISRDEFSQVSKKLTPKQVDAVFTKFDTSKDGRLSLEEFRKLMERHWSIRWAAWTYRVHISKNLTLYKNAHQTKPTIGKWSSLLMLQEQLSHDQSKVKNGNILKWIIDEFQNCFFNVSLLLKFWASGFCWCTL